MSQPTFEHVPVMVEEVLAAMAFEPGQTVVDGTLGMGGHLLAIRPLLGATGHLIGLDRDPGAVETVRARLADEPTEGKAVVTLLHASFEDLREIAAAHAPRGVDRLFLDLGVSRDQLVSGRFSFRGNAPLDFRLDPTQGETAADLLRRLSRDELEQLLREHGDEPFAGRIAEAVVKERAQRPLTTTDELVELVRRCYPAKARHGRTHLATRTFQALRVAVNDLMGGLDRVLNELPELLNPGGRCGVLAYHSGEDRRVKQKFRELATNDNHRLITKRAVQASREEQVRNRSARSARLRVLELGARSEA